jgi:hypothetical protein
MDHDPMPEQQQQQQQQPSPNHHPYNLAHHVCAHRTRYGYQKTKEVSFSPFAPLPHRST